VTDLTDDAPNEILAAAKEAKAHSEAAAKATVAKARTWPLGTIGIGAAIGSAAVAAAVLFANNRKK
jgi:diaminopimelate epimerase